MGNYVRERFRTHHAKGGYGVGWIDISAVKKVMTPFKVKGKFTLYVVHASVVKIEAPRCAVAAWWQRGGLLFSYFSIESRPFLSAAENLGAQRH